MRNNYVELIKEYIKLKPEYKATLDEIKDEVSLVGATPEEFEEAVKQLESVGNQNTVISLKLHRRFSRPKLTIKKTSVLIATLIFLSLGSTIFIFNQTSKTTENPLATINVIAQKSKLSAVPVVYANSTPVNAEKVFSIPSNNINLTISQKPKKEVVGFLPYWMTSEADKIDLRTLTSISLFGLDVNGGGNILTAGVDPQAANGWTMWQDSRTDNLIRKAKSQGLKIYLTFKCFNNNDIEALSQSDKAQKAFIANATYLVESKNLDGINIDFEYVGDPSSVVTDGFTRLITNLNAELKRQNPNAILTIDTYLSSGSDKGLFNLPILAQNSDAFIIMGYDMHTPSSGPGPVAAMGGESNIIGYVQNYLEQVDASKLILAVPYYGYDWPQGIASPSADMVNVLPYAQIADQSSKTQISWNDTAQTPYYNYKDQAGVERIVHFDNVRSLAIKYDFINNKNLKGVGIWALGYDGENQDLEKLLIDKFINQ